MTPAVRRLVRAAGAVAAANGPTPSPCTSVCEIDSDRGWCKGCFRTLEEIGAWSTLDDDGKRVVWARLGPRAQATPQDISDAA
ncbi:MAG TPA: DUF1289 domain-containing protein [Ramlibacter sp.]|nr:DUF1289 domain-containing protein [Ramlibacter sp.]